MFRECKSYGIICVMPVVVTVPIIRPPFVVEGFWTLWKNIYNFRDAVTSISVHI
jgi:hypothetical protein